VDPLGGVPVISLQLGAASYDWDPDELTASQAIAITVHTGLTLAGFDEGLAAGRPGCLEALAWLIFDGGDPSVPIGSMDAGVAALAAQLAGAA
jgi:hypothetical protein